MTSRERQEQIVRDATEPTASSPYIDKESLTWQAIRSAIKEKARDEYFPALRNKQLDMSDVQYARGGLDALESLLNIAGEEL